MKNSTKLLSLFLVLIMLAAALVGCNDNVRSGSEATEDTSNGDIVTEAPADDSVSGTEAPADTEPADPDLVLGKNGEILCTLVRYESFDSASSFVTNTTTLKTFFDKIVGDRIRITTDFNRAIHDPAAVEVLVGYTTYDETHAVLDKIGYGEYAIDVVGNKLVIASHCTSGMNSARNKLMDLVYTLNTEGGNLVIPGDTYITGVSNKMLNTLPKYDGGQFYSDYPCGNDAQQIIINNTTMTEYDAYLEKLESAGFTQYTTTTMAGNKFATYTNADYTVNVGFYDNNDSTRIIIEKLAPAVGLESDNKYTAVTTTSITMLGCDYINSDKTWQGTGLSMAIRLADGSFIVIDGGHNRSDEADSLLRTLKELSKDYRGNEKIRIAAWIITHPHGDHSGMFTNHYDKFKAECKVERVIGNFPDENQRLASEKLYPKAIDANEGSGGNKVVSVAKTLGATMHFVRTGQVFYIADIKMEILYTIDSHGPKAINVINTTSIVIKMTFSDGTVFMMPGDATGNALKICADMYGDYLKCDILQVSHHGYSTGGNDAGTITAYKKMAPSTLLWPTGEDHYSKCNDDTHNKVLFSPTYKPAGVNKNFQEVYVAGKIYEATTTPIPYKVGTTYTWNVK